MLCCWWRDVGRCSLRRCITAARRLFMVIGLSMITALPRARRASCGRVAGGRESLEPEGCSRAPTTRPRGACLRCETSCGDGRGLATARWKNPYRWPSRFSSAARPKTRCKRVAAMQSQLAQHSSESSSTACLHNSSASCSAERSEPKAPDASASEHERRESAARVAARRHTLERARRRRRRERLQERPAKTRKKLTARPPQVSAATIQQHPRR